MAVSKKDEEILRSLAGQQAEIAALPAQADTIAQWKRLNALGRGRPLVCIAEIPWHEMDVDGELALQTDDPFCQHVEENIRRSLYAWRHMPADMVVEGCLYSGLKVTSTDMGLNAKPEKLQTDERSTIASYRYAPQVKDESDVAKIRTPQVFHDEEASRQRFETMSEVFDGVIPVRQRGVMARAFCPCDMLAERWGPQQFLLDLALKPELVHAGMERMTEACLGWLAQWEDLGVLALNNTNVRAGTGGLSYCDELPAEGFDPARVRPADMWGLAMAQIFSEVSPAMHEHIALRYERRWLDKFGLAYYGCCEPLHLKIEIIERHVPNLRKISVSPRADVAVAAEKIGARYVLSLKPNPAVLAWDRWNPEQARRDLRESLAKARGCIVEIVMKDISTVCYEPQRLWEWSRIALEEAAAVA
jgi:hypothetical protein